MASAASGADPAAPALLEAAIKPLPVTILSGFLGAGKTTLLKRILQADHGLRIAVIVNDMAELNVDASIAGSIVESKEQLVAMQNGCICCTLREDLLVEVARLAKSGSFDYLVARLDTMVTLLDAVNFGADLDSMDYLEDRDWAPKEETSATSLQLLIDQLEFADVVIINKIDLATSPSAPGWLKELRGEHVPETEEYAVTSFVLRSHRPFHPARLNALMDSKLFSAGAVAASKSVAGAPGAHAEGEAEEAEEAAAAAASSEGLSEATKAVMRGEAGYIVRSKGIAWVASGEGGMTYRGDWSHSGRLVGLEPAGRWWAAIPKENWPEGMTPYGWVDEEGVGDRQTEIVVIGMGMDKERVEAARRTCIVTDEEFAAGPAAWAEWEDPIWGDVDCEEHAAEQDGEEDEEEHGHDDCGHDHHSHDCGEEGCDECEEDGHSEGEEDDAEAEA
ncbi:hypothetical protein FNF28_07720 [Cafeteria roenbergensis]|uniref:CobW C-terminal domain-containing protein n=1 Tax=Cafeteria roenbergensis TaxID=33653 RepID=A0A5A8C0J1_CAFRO|nr:hypothetical protein FNF28_07720 [Cafeteria roenbergensis]